MRAALPPTPTEEEAIQHVPDDQPAVVLPAATAASFQTRAPVSYRRLPRRAVQDILTKEITLAKIKDHKKRVRDRRKKAKKGQSTEDDVDEAQKAIRNRSEEITRRDQEGPPRQAQRRQWRVRNAN